VRAVRGLLQRSSPLENPAVPLTLSSASASDLWGPGVPGEGAPLRIGAAFRCAQIIAGAIAGCPLRGTNRDTRARVELDGLPGTDSVLTRYGLIETTVLHLVLHGNAFGRTWRAPSLRVVETEPLLPTSVTPEVYRTPEGRRRVRFLYNGETLSSLDVSHTAAMSHDGVRGLSVVAQMRRTFELAAAGERAAATLFDRGLVAPVALTTEARLAPEVAAEMETKIQARLSGTDGVGRVAVFHSGVKPYPLSMSFADAQFLEQRKFSVTEIARLYGVPGWMVNDQEKSTSWGSGMEQQFTSFVVLTLKPWMQRLEQRIARDYVQDDRVKVEFDANGLLRGDSRARAAFYNAGITGGWLVPNEPRALEDLKPVPWGDEPYLINHGGTTADTSTDQPQGAPDATIQ
jgi:HK97 family phage portal protein